PGPATQLERPDADWDAAEVDVDLPIPLPVEVKQLDRFLLLREEVGFSGDELHSRPQRALVAGTRRELDRGHDPRPRITTHRLASCLPARAHADGLLREQGGEAVQRRVELRDQRVDDL